MKLSSIRVFDGRNIYSHKKCIRLDVDLEGYGEIPSKDIEGFNKNLVRLLPELTKHRCGIDEDAGFVKRLTEGTYLAHICEHIIIALQNLVGIDTPYGKARIIDGDKYYIIFQYEYVKTAVKCANLAIDIVNELISKKKTVDFNERIKDIKDTLGNEYIGPSTGAICDEARKMGIPITKLGDTGLYQLSFGKYGKLIEATICENTTAIAVDISCDKLITKTILQKQSLPVAEGYKVENVEQLVYFGEKIGYPLVIKPQFGNQGKGVIVNIKNRNELLKAYNKICKCFKDIIVEGYVKGNDYRVCVVNGEIVAVALRIPPFIIGDGKKNIRSLISDINMDIRRGNGHEKPLTKIKIDDDLLERLQEDSLNLNTILPKGKKVFLRGNANLSTGGVSIDCTDEICEENKEVCKRAASAVGLNICGIDICCMDISMPLREQGTIVEINAAPGIRMHHYPYEGKPRNVAKAIVDMMFADTPKNIPIISITGTNGKTTTTRLIGHVMSLAGYNVGMTTTGGIYVNNKCIQKGDTTGYESAMAILLNKEVDAAVLETARGGLIRKGLAYDLADVGVITNITGDHMGLDGVKNIEDLAKVKALVVEAVKENGYAVINGDDEVSTTILDRIKSNLVVFSMSKENKVMRNNIENGGIGIYYNDGKIYMEKEGIVLTLSDVKDIPITLKGKLKFNIENCMAAISALIAIGIEPITIAKGISSFSGDEKSNPARFNMFDINGVTVILDYGHNIDGYRVIIESLKSMDHSRLVGIIGVPGDRPDNDMVTVGKMCGDGFDYIYIKEDRDRRGREIGEVADILKAGVMNSEIFNEDNIDIILDERDALSKAIDNSRYGDIIIAFVEDYESMLNLIKSKMQYIDKKEKIMA